MSSQIHVPKDGAEDISGLPRWQQGPWQRVNIFSPATCNDLYNGECLSRAAYVVCMQHPSQVSVSLASRESLVTGEFSRATGTVTKCSSQSVCSREAICIMSSCGYLHLCCHAEFTLLRRAILPGVSQHYIPI